LKHTWMDWSIVDGWKTARGWLRLSSARHHHLIDQSQIEWRPTMLKPLAARWI
jgi:hypothetical protein